MKLRCLFTAVLAAGSALSLSAAAITASAVGGGSCVVATVSSVTQGCVAQSSYVTGDGAGGTIHNVDFNGQTSIDPNGVATYSGTWQYNGGSRPANDNSDYVSINGSAITIDYSSGL